jgi:hypothetical protein
VEHPLREYNREQRDAFERAYLPQKGRGLCILNSSKSVNNKIRQSRQRSQRN